MSGIRGELRPNDGASGKNRRRNTKIGEQPSCQIAKIEAPDGYQAVCYIVAAPRIIEMQVVRGVHMLKAIHAQESRKAAQEKANALRSRRMTKAAELIEGAIGETLTYLLCFPRQSLA